MDSHLFPQSSPRYSPQSSPRRPPRTDHIIKQPVVYIMASPQLEKPDVGTRLTNIGNGSLQGVGHVPLCPTYEAKVE